MSASLAIHKTPCHVRSISLPSRSHPLIANVVEQLDRLRASEAIFPSSPSSIGHNLEIVNDLYECVDGVLQLPLTQQAFSHERNENEKWVDEVLDGSLRLLDVCGTTGDVLSQTKDCVQDLESSLRRREGGEFGLANKVGTYMISRKKTKKVVCKCLGDLKRVDKEEADINEIEKADVAVYALNNKKSCKEIDVVQVQNVQKQLEALESSIQDLEEGLESVFRRLIKTRVSLLNMLNH
ncbi:hypothetical protein HHK36_031110 [Tetracentron sinense]|uniref:Uncharacterized protein n=1 Tax=Tetracentron sinense TaxID=13715 RepID=A0A835D1D4_TETSI|nr:hypothetical protein HHK36_031110 [Tetracentron sinense]